MAPLKPWQRRGSSDSSLGSSTLGATPVSTPTLGASTPVPGVASTVGGVTSSPSTIAAAASTTGSAVSPVSTSAASSYSGSSYGSGSSMYGSRYGMGMGSSMYGGYGGSMYGGGYGGYGSSMYGGGMYGGMGGGMYGQQGGMMGQQGMNQFFGPNNEAEPSHAKELCQLNVSILDSLYRRGEQLYGVAQKLIAWFERLCLRANLDTETTARLTALVVTFCLTVFARRLRQRHQQRLLQQWRIHQLTRASL
eukprot:gnl/MRDRNA2_/MRDRNA2_82558_c0_seq2.p1 gnl/MRDRNA2_/MRDRNA2_82558_c0~~gnl/MRDRNA2_/MRDRNA2_82558_c0_seq2.p1  ORF type:complete len:271 (-),score=41.19 gnl/MRDRNA2_/MRDRNA2_82558_c0_seq2:7-756(-)